jgi:hypothetical protein
MRKEEKVDSSGAAIVCRHVAKERLPILKAIKYEPVQPEDSGWQFLCNTGKTENTEDAQVWSIDNVKKLEPSLKDLLEKPIGTTLVRESPKDGWRII